MARVFIYVISHDLGFAPNPFHGVCTLACCKPVIRRTSKVGDWIIGMGGRALKATGHCIYAMQVTASMSFEEYWVSDEYRQKRPVRNGSRRSMVGDNIYSLDAESGHWVQDNSVHSLPSGDQNDANTAHDTSVNRVLISKNFLYFGENAPKVPQDILEAIGYNNGRGHRVFKFEQCNDLFTWLYEHSSQKFNLVLGDPFQFRISEKRYSIEKNKLI
jgi:hypothetical protein